MGGTRLFHRVNRGFVEMPVRGKLLVILLDTIWFLNYVYHSSS